VPVLLKLIAFSSWEAECNRPARYIVTGDVNNCRAWLYEDQPNELRSVDYRVLLALYVTSRRLDFQTVAYTPARDHSDVDITTIKQYDGK